MIYNPIKLILFFIKVIQNTKTYISNKCIYQRLLIHHVKFYYIYQLLLSVLFGVIIRIYLDFSTIIPVVHAAQTTVLPNGLQQTIYDDGLYTLIIYKDPVTREIATTLILNETATDPNGKIINTSGLKGKVLNHIVHTKYKNSRLLNQGPLPTEVPSATTQAPLFRIDLRSIFDAVKRAWFHTFTKSTDKPLDTTTLFTDHPSNTNNPIPNPQKGLVNPIPNPQKGLVNPIPNPKKPLPNPILDPILDPIPDNLPLLPQTFVSRINDLVTFSEAELIKHVEFFNRITAECVRRLCEIHGSTKVNEDRLSFEEVRSIVFQVLKESEDKRVWLAKTPSELSDPYSYGNKRADVAQYALQLVDMSRTETKVLVHTCATMISMSTANAITSEELGIDVAERLSQIYQSVYDKFASNKTKK